MSYPLWTNLKVLSKISVAHPNDTSVQYFYTQWFFLVVNHSWFQWSLLCRMDMWHSDFSCQPWMLSKAANHLSSLRRSLEASHRMTRRVMSIFLRERTNGSEFKGLGIFQFEPQQKNSWLVAFFTQKLLVQFTVYWPLFYLFRSSNGLVQKP